jgi:hypothetical protein
MLPTRTIALNFVIIFISVPCILSKMEYAIRNEDLCMDAADLCLVCLKEEWMK